MISDSEVQIEIHARSFSSVELKQRLEIDAGVSGSHIALRLLNRPLAVRGNEATILIAAVGAAGGAIGALVSGLLQIAREAKAAKLILQDQSGRRIEVPAETPPERITELVSILKEMEQPKITLR